MGRGEEAVQHESKAWMGWTICCQQSVCNVAGDSSISPFSFQLNTMICFIVHRWTSVISVH